MTPPVARRRLLVLSLCAVALAGCGAANIIVALPVLRARHWPGVLNLQVGETHAALLAELAGLRRRAA